MATIAADRSAATGPDTPHAFSCNACQVAFRNSDLQKSHMKGDWHRYNLKRRLAGLRPISAELFAEKVLQSQAGAAAEAGRATYERTCDICLKSYGSENSYQNHISSQKHKARAAHAGTRGANGKKAGDDVSSVMSSTFSLGEPNLKAQKAKTSSEIVDSDAEEEFSHVIEGFKNATIEEGHSPVKRPANPRLSAAAHRKEEHPLETDAAQSEVTSTGDVPTPAASKASEPAHSTKLCLFCNHASPTVAENVLHMERLHGMFIPEKQYLVDIEGLLTYLETIVRDAYECIYCGKPRRDVYAVQTHMRDKAHCMIPYTTVEDQVLIGDYYDFRSTYSDGGDDEEEYEDVEDEDDQKKGDEKHGGVKLGAKRATKTVVVSGDEETDDSAGEGDGWETDNSESSLDSNDLTAVPADNRIQQYERLDKNPHHSLTDPRPHRQADGWHSRSRKPTRAVYYDDYELHLPSGRSVGHRSGNRYYKQNLHNYPSFAEREKWTRLAIESGEIDEDEDAMDIDGGAGANGPSSALARRTNKFGSRAVSTRPDPRNTLGLAGVTDRTKAGLLKSERRAVLAKTIAADKGRIKFSANSIGQSFRFLGRT